MKLLALSPDVLALTLSMAFLSSAALQNIRAPLPNEFEPFRLSIGADSVPDFVSSRSNPYEIPRNNNPDLGDDDDNDINANEDDPDRKIAATVDIDIVEVKIYSDNNRGTEPGKPPFTVASPSNDAVMRYSKVVSGLYPFQPPMEIVDVKVTGGPSDADSVECFIITEVRGQYIKFGRDVWITAQNAVGVYCSAHYAMEEVEEGRTGLE